MLTSAQIKTRAHQLGFDACGIAPAADLEELGFFREWIARGYAGTMTYLERSADRRSDVRRVLASSRTVIVVATVYNTSRPFSTACTDPDRVHVARYAWGDDYHDIVGRRLNSLLEWMRTASSDPFEARAYVDTGPVQERVYARHAGIGWIGKNSCLISPQLGSWVFLAEILCSLALEVDAPALDQCGSCTLCVEACPTQAIVAPGVLDSTRCISYLTIEHRGAIPGPLHKGIGSRVYGCDVCQEVCPWNAMAPTTDDPAWQPRPVWDLPAAADLARMSDDELRPALSSSAMRRAKLEGIRRNIAIVVDNGART